MTILNLLPRLAAFQPNTFTGSATGQLQKTPSSYDLILKPTTRTGIKFVVRIKFDYHQPFFSFIK